MYKLLTLFPKACITHSPATKSDHSLVLESNMDGMKRARLIKFTATWIRDESYEDVVSEAWYSSQVGSPSFSLYRKIERVKRFLSR